MVGPPRSNWPVKASWQRVLDLVKPFCCRGDWGREAAQKGLLAGAQDPAGGRGGLEAALPTALRGEPACSDQHLVARPFRRSQSG